MDVDDFADKVLEIVKDNKSEYTEDFQKWQEKDYLTDYEDEADMRKQLSNRFQKQGCIKDREKLLDILYWKLNPRNYEASKNNSEEKNTEEEIQQVTARAFELDDAQDSMKALTELAGVGPAVASTILMFYKPNKYTVLDQHAWRAASELDRDTDPEPEEFTAQGYASYNRWCHDILHGINREAEEDLLTMRQLDMALHSLGKEHA
jgi:hypothetical protein